MQARKRVRETQQADGAGEKKERSEGNRNDRKNTQRHALPKTADD
jgi:hypothetical protein